MRRNTAEGEPGVRRRHAARRWFHAGLSTRLVFAVGLTIIVLPLPLEPIVNGSDIAAWGTLTTVCMMAIGLWATVACVSRSLRSPSTDWMWMSAAVASFVLGAVGLVGKIEWSGDPGWPTRWNIGFVLWPLFAVMALWQRQRPSDLYAKLAFYADATLFALGLSFLVWDLGIATRLDGEPLTAAQELLLAFYPFGSMLVASVFVFLLMAERSPARWALFGSSMLITIGQMAFAANVRIDNRALYGVFMATFLVAMLCMAVAGTLRGAGSFEGDRPSATRMVVAVAPVLAAGLVIAVRYLGGSDRASLGTTALGSTMIVVLVVARGSAWVTTRTLTIRLQRNVRSLRAREHDLQMLLDDLPTSVLVINRFGQIQEANAGALELTGRSEAGLQRLTFGDLIPVDEQPLLFSLWQRVLEGEDLDAPIFRFERPDGTVMFLEASVRTPIRDLERIVVDLRDLTGDLEQRRRLQEAQERFRMAFHDAPTGMSMARADDGVMVDVNESMLRIVGCTREEFVGSTIESITHPDDWAFEREMLNRVLSGKTESYRMEKRYLHSDGHIVWAMLSVSVLHDPSGPSLTLAHVEDITESRRAAEQLEWAATHDELTRLPNRFHFLDQLAKTLHHAEPGSVAVLFIDLDNFKVINDSLGHAAGDQLLRGMSERLRRVVRDRDLLGRFGGDEFIVMLRDVGTEVAPLDVAERLRHEIADPLMTESGELFVTASIGIVVFDGEASTSDLLRDADAAMYRAKARSRNCVEMFAPGSHETSVLTLRTTNELRRGLDRGEILPYFQPIVGLADGRLRGFEVLARWRHPDRGLLGPEQFLPMAEEIGLVVDIGSMVLRESLAHLGIWQNRLTNFRDLTLSVNVSPRQLMNSEFPDMVADALAESGVPAASLWLEITETALMSDAKSATVALRELRNLGLHLAVDDFGTGYSSLTYLKRFPVESIKVDRTFVGGLGIDSEDSSIVEAVVNLGHSLGLTVVAEGVETPLQLSRLRDSGCDFGQGYLFGRPRPAELVESEYSLV